MRTSSAVPPATAPVKDHSPTASDSEEYEYEEVEIEEEVEVEEEVSDDDDDDEEEFEEVEVEVEEEEEEEEEEEQQEKEDVSRSIEDLEDVNIPPVAVPVKDQSLTGSDSEEYEYEEMEIEEEIEVEEEVSDDEEEEEVEEEEEEEVEEEVEEEEEAVEEEQKEERQQEKGSAEDVSRSIEDPGDVKRKEKIVSDDEKASQCDGGIMTAETTKIVSDDEKASQCDGGIMTAETTNSVNESSKPITVGDSVDESDKVPRSKEQTTQMDIKDVNDAHLTEPECTRVLVLAETTNSVNESGKPVTAGDSVDESNKVPRSEKQQATQMDIKDVNDANLTEPRLDVDVPLIRPRSSSPAVEVNKGNKRPALVCEFFAKGWCIKGTSCKFRHIKDPPVDQQNEPQKSQPQDEGVKESMGKSDNLATSATTSTLVACSSNTVTNPPVNKSLGNPFMGPNAHRTSWASFAPKPQEFSGKGYHFGIHNHGYNVTNHDTVWPRAPTFLSSLSQKSNLKSSSYKWEPSKPFRSTFLISQGIYSSDIQYDPIRDSIEQPTKNGDKLSKLSSSSRVPSISGTHTPLQEKLKIDIGSDRVSVGSHVNGNDDDIDMDVDSNEIADTKHEYAKSESKGKRHIGDVIQASKVHASGHYSLQHTDDGPAKEANSYKLDFDAEADMHRESKSVRHFRASLIEFVKELVRPSWRDGKLSKDAHKLIVKKTVDKVLTSLPTEYVPDVQESIDTYLSSSQPKLMKLVEGYIEKYGKL